MTDDFNKRDFNQQDNYNDDMTDDLSQVSSDGSTDSTSEETRKSAAIYADEDAYVDTVPVAVPVPDSVASTEIEPIPADQARVILERAIRERCGDDWRDEESGWIYVTGHDYMARLTRGRVNLDFYVDLLGEVTVTRSEINSAQDSGRIVAWMLLLLSLGIAYALARAIGWL
jgi:hypothetical protein